MAVVLVLKLVALALAGYASLRARLHAGVGALVSVAYLTLARLAGLMPPYPALPLREALDRTWWLYPTISALLALGPMAFALRAARDAADPARQRALERAGYGYLACLVLDVIVLVMLAVALAA